MKIDVAKRDLDAALQVVSIGTSGTGSDLSTHFLFRELDGQVSVLAYNGRLGAGIPLVCKSDTSSGETAFTVESWRLKQWLGAVEDAALTLDYTDGVVKATSPKGTIKFRSLDPKAFPYWDDSLKAAEKTMEVEAGRLFEAFSHAKLFINEKKETSAPHLAVCEVKKGSLQATDQAALTLVTLDDLKDSSARVHGKDLQQVLSFLGLSDTDKVEVLEGDRSMFICRADGGVLSIGRPHTAFPNISVSKDSDDAHWWEVSTTDLESAILQLSASASKEDRRLTFNFDPEAKEVLMSMTSASGSTDILQLECPDFGSKDGAADIPEDGFAVEYPYLQALLSSYKGKTIRFGINPQKKGGWIRFREDKGGDDYLTMLVWLV